MINYVRSSCVIIIGLSQVAMYGYLKNAPNQCIGIGKVGLSHSHPPDSAAAIIIFKLTLYYVNF